MLVGPDLDQLRSVLGATHVPVIASGGVGSLPDLLALAELADGDRRLEGAIVGKALYEGRFSVAEALAAVG
jgi:phosphoribosylformimino-5-aminoimidazole carboxamide ribonucleotide (ProFAR) isomerase